MCGRRIKVAGGTAAAEAFALLCPGSDPTDFTIRIARHGRLGVGRRKVSADRKLRYREALVVRPTKWGDEGKGGIAIVG